MREGCFTTVTGLAAKGARDQAATAFPRNIPRGIADSKAVIIGAGPMRA